MYIISNELGYVMVFEKTDELKKTVDNLSGFLEKIEVSSTEKPPHLYMVYENRIPSEEITSFLNDLKNKIQG